MERKFDCSFPGCGKSFKRRDYLTRHESNHSDVRPFECDLCHKSFARRDLLDKHHRSKSHLMESSQRQNIVISMDKEPQMKKARLHSPTVDLKTFDHESLESLMTSGRFSNVANALEDSFGWLFGPGAPQELTYDPILEDLNRMVNPSEDMDILDFGVNEDTMVKVQRFLRNDVKMNDDFLTIPLVNKYLTKYWGIFNSVYPVIHRPTFDPNAYEKHNLNTYFLLSLITVGMACSGEQENRRKCVEIQTTLRMLLHHILANTEYDVSFISLKLIQSLLLNDVFHLYYGTTHQHVKFTIYYPVLINVLKEMKVFVNLTEPYVDHSNVDFQKWSKWIRYESFKRIALFAYCIDTQASFFLGMSPTISVFDVQLELPYSDTVWLAADYMRFAAEYRKVPRDLVERLEIKEMEEKRYQINKEDVMSNGNLIPNVKGESRWPNFLWSIRRLMQPFKGQDREYHMNCFSQFSRYVFLHGVLSLVKELRMRNIFMFDNRDSSAQLNFVAAKIEQAFFSWRAYFHRHIASANAATLQDNTENMLNSYDTSPIFWSNITLMNCGLMGLYCNFAMIVQYSKSVMKSLNSELSEILINSPGKLRFDAIESTKNKILVFTWAKSKDGEHALTQACLLLQTVLANQDIISKVPHAAYGVYLAVLICWAQQQGSDPVGSTPEEVSVEVLKDRAMQYINQVLQKQPMMNRLLLRSLMMYSVYMVRQRRDQDDIGLKELSLLAGML